MEVDLFSLLPKPSIKPDKAESQKNEGSNFFNLVLSGLKETNKLANNADKLTEDLVTGRLENIHDLMIAAEKAGVALNFTMAIRTQALKAYQEIMGMGR